MRHTGNRIGGSNPSLSATQRPVELPVPAFGAAQVVARLTSGGPPRARHGGLVFVSQQKPKHESVRDQKERHDKRWEKVGSAQLTGLDAQKNAFVIGME